VCPAFLSLVLDDSALWTFAVGCAAALGFWLRITGLFSHQRRPAADF
jgi:hypothetical protein